MPNVELRSHVVSIITVIVPVFLLSLTLAKSMPWGPQRVAIQPSDRPPIA